MKITENSSSKLVVAEGSIASRITGIILTIVGILIIPTSLLYALIAIGLGLLLTLGAKNRRLTIDKTARTVSYAQKSIFKKSNKLVNFADVKEVKLHKRKQVFNNQAGNYSSNSTSVVGLLYINLLNGEEIYLDYDAKKQKLFKSVDATTLGNEALGNQIAAAIGVPFVSGSQANPQPTIQN